MKIVKKILNTIINILIILVLITSVAVATLALTSKANNGVATIFGYAFHTIQTPSMQGGSDVYEGGDYDPGDLVIGKSTQSDPSAEYQLGDIVVYTEQNDGEDVKMISHRIIEIDEDDSGNTVYTTKGDNNDIPDLDTHTAAQIVSVCYTADYHGPVLKGFGKVLDFIRQPQGFFFVVLLPMIIFFLYEIIRVVLNAVNYKNEKAKEEKDKAEQEKQEAIEAAVAAAKAELGDKQPAAPAGMTDEQMEQFKQFMAFQQMQNAQNADAAPEPAPEPAPEAEPSAVEPDEET